MFLWSAFFVFSNIFQKFTSSNLLISKNSNKEMDLKQAQETFRTLLNQFSHQEAQKDFLIWINKEWIKDIGSNFSDSKITLPFDKKSEFTRNDKKLQKIASDLREIVPLNAILSSEQIAFPTVGENADCDPSHTQHVDAFLYDEDLVEELCDTGKLARNYCLNCSSHNTQPLTYISHSMSRERLAYIFYSLLPSLPEEAVILDVGSRLGAVLYGAYVYTKCRRIIGVEINEDLCQVQQTIVNKHQFQDRIQIVHGDVKEHSEIVQIADVIILHNVFEFFVPPDVQAQIWHFLKTNIKKGTLLVTVPSLHECFQYLQVGFEIEEWVQELQPHNPNLTASFSFQAETSEVRVYQVV